MKKVGPLIEVAVVIALFVYLRPMLRDTALRNWEVPVFGATPLSSALLFLVFPLLVVAVTGRATVGLSLTTVNPRYHFRVGLNAVAVPVLATMLFPVIAALGSDHKHLLGASILTGGFMVAGFYMARMISNLDNARQSTIDLRGSLVFVALLVAGLVLTALFNTFSSLLAKLVIALVFVAFLEELFFRGYIQTRLNEVFGKPFQFRGVSYGYGLLIAALVFGLMHPLTSPDEITPWPWALWTTTGGLLFGYIREKSGAVIAPALVHGIILIPAVLFGS